MGSKCGTFHLIHFLLKTRFGTDRAHLGHMCFLR